jgi:hypothetical protein
MLRASALCDNIDQLVRHDDYLHDLLALELGADLRVCLCFRFEFVFAGAEGDVQA